MAGIYIHIPYCRQACHYCNFHFSTSLKSKSALVASIIKELKYRKSFFRDQPIKSIYFGGGTPSLLEENELEQIINVLHNNYLLEGKQEITLEANPEDITSSILNTWHQLGINRLSIGIQSFLDKDLKYMNRAHSAGESEMALRIIQKSNFENVTADLMFGLIGSDLTSWKYNLDKILEFDIRHLSIYNLTIEEQTVFANWKLKNKLSEIPSETQREQFQFAEALLQDKGYDHYEISNYCKDHEYAIHNTNYWNRVPYLGIGPSAHSFDGEKRYWNTTNNAHYIKQWKSDEHQSEEEKLSIKEVYNEVIMLGLRTKWGIDKNAIAEMPQDIRNHFKNVSTDFFKQNILIRKNNRIILNPNHWYLSDHYASELFWVGSTS